ncbi:unnamed protein product, partial [Polarella glacialis]
AKNTLASVEAPLWLRWPRSARALATVPGPQGRSDVEDQGGIDLLQAVSAPVTYARVEFASPLSPEKRVVVEHALVDTGSSDCEIREGLLRKIGPLPLIAGGVMYETATGGEAYDVYEVLLTVLGRTCVAAITVVPDERYSADAEDPNSDEAILGHVALAALRLLVDPAGRQLLPRDAWNSSCQQEQA